VITRGLQVEQDLSGEQRQLAVQACTVVDTRESLYIHGLYHRARGPVKRSAPTSMACKIEAKLWRHKDTYIVNLQRHRQSDK
jgi:hypothetical protein